MYKYILVLRVPILILFLNYIFVFFSEPLLKVKIIIILSLFIKSAVYVLAGWLLVIKLNKPIRVCFFIGIIIFLIEHVLLKGMYFFFETIFKYGKFTGDFLLPFYGLLITYIFYFLIAGILTCLGGVIAQKSRKAA